MPDAEEWKNRYCSLLVHYEMLIRTLEAITPQNSVDQVFQAWYKEGCKDGE